MCKKQSFFEKKDQKTFAYGGLGAQPALAMEMMQDAASQGNTEAAQIVNVARQRGSYAYANLVQQQPFPLAVPEAGSSAAAGTHVSPARLARFLEGVLHEDSSSWLHNQYVENSVSGASIVDGTPRSGSYAIRGNYKFMAGSDPNPRDGWLSVRIENDRPACLTYWDFPGSCRAPGAVNAFATGLAVLAGVECMRRYAVVTERRSAKKAKSLQRAGDRRVNNLTNQPRHRKHRKGFGWRGGNPSIITAVVTALSFSATVPAGAGEMLCRQAAVSLRIGNAAPSTLLHNLNDVVEAREEGTDASAVLRTWHAGPDLLHAIDDMTAGGQLASRVMWLAQGALGAVEVIAGTADCQTLIFFRVPDGKAVRFAAPKGLNTDQACWGDSVWLGTISGTPYAVEENNVLGDRARSIVASGWTGTGWDPPCSLTEMHSIILAVDNLFCRPGMDCTTLQAVALERAKEAQAEHERATPAIGPVDALKKNDTGAADQTDLPKEIPTFGESRLNPFTAFTNEHAFQTSYLGQPVVGAIGAGHFGWRDYDGWLVAFWRTSKDGYDPLAGLQITRQLGVVLSLEVNDP